MKIAVLANDAQWSEVTADANEAGFVRISSLEQSGDSIEAYVILEAVSNEELNDLRKPALLNSVVETLKELNAGKNIVRINGWNGFLSRKTWDIAGIVTDEIRNVFTTLNRQYVEVPDEPGLIAARPVAMIINEAYFALEQQVSTKAGIDIAMKLGTNYPHGPFEWAEQIGVTNIYKLLLSLSKTDKRYIPAGGLKNEATT
ncbi:MAG: hypothetical protein IPP72_12205 [Chitinophagaceae bacterium]|nr:hypothetical protein [Chitinophagaceae bacterium]